MKNALELQNVSKSFKGFEMKDMTFFVMDSKEAIKSF